MVRPCVWGGGGTCGGLEIVFTIGNKLQFTNPIRKLGFLDGMRESECSIETLGIDKALLEEYKIV